MKSKIIPFLFVTVCLFNSQSMQTAGAQEKAPISFKELKTPAGLGAREPHLFASPVGKIFMSWTEPVESGGFAVRFAVGTVNGWSEARTITAGDDLFVNWADFPSITTFPDGTLAAHWLRKNGEKSYAYDVNIAFSKDSGITWSRPIVPHRDGSTRQHGFVSLLPLPDKRLFMIWLDGRNYSDAGGFAAGNEAGEDAMQLRFATLGEDGALSYETVLDPRTCTCCKTAAALTPGGAVVAYRGRTKEDIRDIKVLRLERGAWSKPVTVHDDGWQIYGCPVNGPAIDADGQHVAVAWFTAARDTPRVNVAFSQDGGETFSAPIAIDEGSPEGRVGITLLPDGSALVSWLEMTRVGEKLLTRRVEPNGSRDPTMTLALTKRGRTSGFPQVVRSGNEIYFAWTQSATPTGMRGGPGASTLNIGTAVGTLRR